ncbi:hypothetical protein SERLADRAFT_358650, partial [Serpula lacrymans var. lacrymans S7.9]
MKMLDEVSKVHPFVAVAVLAFKAVVTLELKRRDNDKKVIALKMGMKDMMVILLQLRFVKDSKQKLPDGTTLQGRMQELMKQVASDITDCGNVCDAYTKKNLVVKVFKGPIWEDRLAGFVDTFVERRKEIELALSIHTTLGVDNANQTLAGLTEGLRAVNAKLDMLLLFRKLDSAQEKEISKIMAETKGGAKACIDNDDTLQKLILIGRKKDKSSKAASAPLDPHILVAVRNDILEDLDKTLSNNMELFDRKMAVQKRQLVEELNVVVHREGDRIISAVASGSHDKLIDPDLHQIWKEMGWKGNVKARHFVLALHDYFVDKFQEYDEQKIINTPCSLMSPLPPEDGFDPSLTLSITATSYPMKIQADDRWALAYINVSHVQPILEAFDDDSSGFVSIKEANNFSAARPKDWSLPHWLAYWAAGWHSITWEYSLRIGKIRQKMYHTLKDVLPENKSITDQYLDSAPLGQIEMLCASIQRCDDDVVQDALLNEKIRPYMESEQKRIEANLKLITYNIDAANTVALVVGPGRIERYIFPLLYILLRHHLRMIKLACKGIFAQNEMVEAGWSLARVMTLVDERINNVVGKLTMYILHIIYSPILALFKQKNLDVSAQLGIVAFGMTAFSEMGEDCDIWYGSDSENDDDEDGEVDPAILKFGFTRHQLDVTAYEDPPPEEVDLAIHLPDSGFPRIEGTWSGLYFYDDDDLQVDGSMLISIDKSLEDGSFSGGGMDGLDKFNVKGDLRSCDKSTNWDIDLVKSYITAGHSWTYQGKLDVTTATIDGRWGNAEYGGKFHLQMSPISSQRFRYSAEEYSENKAQARWTFACEAVLYHVRRRMWSWRFFEGRREDRKRFVDLYSRRELAQAWSLDDKFDFEDEAQELENMERNLLPQDVRFYRSMAEVAVRDSVIHSNVRCDSCDATISGIRVVCLECITENFRNHVDLCFDCLSMETADESFDHSRTHAMVKVQRVFHQREVSPLIRNSRKAVERARDFMRLRDELEDKPIDYARTDDGDDDDADQCSDCDHRCI